MVCMEEYRMKKRQMAQDKEKSDKEKRALLNEVMRDHKKKSEDAERETVLYAIANDMANMRANQAEADNIVATFNDMKDGQYKECSDGIKRSREYYRHLYFQYFWAAKYQNILLSRKMIERGITDKDIQEFVNKKVQ